MTDLLVDSNSLFARSWFAASTVASNPAQALTYALRTVLLLLNPDANRIGVHLDRCLFCWDGAQNPDKGRSEKPPEYHDTKTLFKDTLSMMLQCAHCEFPAYEADDLIATAVHQSTADNVYVVSGDKDLMQLQGPKVHYYCLNTKAVLSTAFINSRWHIKKPNQVAIALAIIGDPVDKIAGIKGWGPKKVQRLFEAITPEMTFAEVVAALDEKIPEQHKEAFYMALSRTLLRTDIPDVPSAAPIVLVEPGEIEALQLPGLMGTYRETYGVYNEVPY